MKNAVKSIAAVGTIASAILACSSERWPIMLACAAVLVACAAVIVAVDR